MAFHSKTIQATKAPSSPYEPKVYIRDKNRRWVDFSDRVKSRQNLLATIGNISLNSERRAGTRAFVSSISSIEMDNSDGFWLNPFPALTATDGSTASFDTSYGATRPSLSNKWLRISIRMLIGDNQISEDIIATFIIRGIKNNLSKGTVSLKIESFDQALKRRDASIVKDGDNWYANRSVDYLTKELLKVEFGGENSGNLPNTFIIPSGLTIETPDNVRTLSAIGQTPDFTDTDNDGVADTFLERNLVCHAMVMGPEPDSLSTSGAVDSGLSRDTIYLGCDNQLFSYSPSTDTYRVLDDTTLASTYQIRALWYSAQKTQIFGIAVLTTTLTDLFRGTFVFFNYNGSTITSYLPSGWITYGVNAIIGNYAVRQKSGASDTDAGMGQQPGGVSNNGENHSIPFSQTVTATNATLSGSTDIALYAGSSGGELGGIFTDADATALYSFDLSPTNVQQQIRRGFFYSAISPDPALPSGITSFICSYGTPLLASFDNTNTRFYIFSAQGTGALTIDLVRFDVATNAMTSIRTLASTEGFPLCVEP